MLVATQHPVIYCAIAAVLCSSQARIRNEPKHKVQVLRWSTRVSSSHDILKTMIYWRRYMCTNLYSSGRSCNCKLRSGERQGFPLSPTLLPLLLLEPPLQLPLGVAFVLQASPLARTDLASKDSSAA
jgi:hypothetical protein